MQSKPTPSGVDRFSASLNASALSWASGLGKLTTTPTRSSRAGVSCLACFQKQLFAMWMWRMYWISLHTLIDSRLFAWDVSADHQPLSARPHQPGREHLGEPIATLPMPWRRKDWLLNLKTATPQCEGIIDEVRSGQRGGGSAEAAYDGSPSQAQNIELLCSTPERRWVRGVGDILWWSNGGLKGKPPVRGVSSWWHQHQI